MIPVRQLKLLSALVETGSVTKAAEEIGVTQPAASKALASLQELAGFRVFVKQNNRIQLTAKGLSLLDEANRLVRISEEFDGIVADIRERGAQRIRIVTTQSIFSSSAFAESLAEFSRTYPNVRFEIESATRDELIRAVETERADIALAFGPMPARRVTAEVFGRSQLCAVSKRGGMLAGVKDVDAAYLSRCPLVVFFARSRHRRLIDQFFERSGHSPNIFAEVANASASISIASTGAAIGICDAHYVQDRPNFNLDIRPLGPEMSLDIAFVQRTNANQGEYILGMKQIIARRWNRSAEHEDAASR